MRNILLSLFFILVPMVAFSQVLIKGTVKDATNNEPLVGAFVFIEGTTTSVTTDVNGEYELIFPSQSKPKYYIIKAQYLGFKDEVDAVEIIPIDNGETLIRNFSLEVDQLTIKDVTVSANKVEEDLQDVAVAGTVIDAQNLAKRTVSNTEEAVASVPNLVTDAFLPSRATFSLRGLASDFTNVGIENSIGLYIDDIYYSRSYNFNSTLIDIERIEVLRGPQGTLFGKNSVGGLIHVISEKPKMGNFGALELSAGSFRLLQIRGKANYEVIKDKLAIRIAGAHKRRDGWLRQDNQIVSEENRTDFYGGRFSALYQVSDNFKLTFQGFYNKDNSAEFTEDYKTPIEGVDLLRVDAVERSETDRVAYENETARAFNRETYGAILRSEWKMDKKHTLTSITGYNGFNSFQARDFDATSVNAVYTDKQASLDNISQEIRVSTPRTNQKFFYVGGVYVLKETNRNTDSLAFKEDMLPVWKVVLGNPALDIPNYFESVSLDATINSLSYAAYASASYEIA